MKKIIIITLMLALSAGLVQAQTTNNAVTEHDPSVKARDASVKTDIIDPAEQAINGDAPDWAALTQTITKKYDATTADRTITKAKIYFYFNKDWSVFCQGIINYTNKYELANDYKLLDFNANYILKYSDDKKELETALAWSKHTLDKDPQNDAYKKTFAALNDKLATK